MRLAEVYIRLGKKTEAWQIFAAAAESLRNRGALQQAEEILQRMLTLDPGNSYALLLRGKTCLESGDAATAVQYLEKVADLDSHPDGLHTLLQAYLQTGRLPDAGGIAVKLATVHNDIGAIAGYADALLAGGHYEEALQLFQQHSDRLLSADSSKVLESLHSIIGHVRENTAALECLLDLLNRAGEQTHLTEIYELLAHAYVQSGDLEKARDYYLKLTQLEPQNQLHARNYQQVLAKLGGTTGTRLITAEEGAIMVDELEATAPFVDQRYSDEVALTVRAALTDAELFISYNMPAKALGPLLSVLPKSPRDLRVNQRLAALHTRASRFAEAAVCCRTLESIYHDAGHPEEASRYGELAAKYEERSSVGAAPAAGVLPVVDDMPAVAAQPEFELQTGPMSNLTADATVEPADGLYFHTPPSDQPGEFNVQAAPAAEGEIDISAEWEGTGTDAPAASEEDVSVVEEDSEADAEAILQTVEEVRFYLKHSMADQASVALDKLIKMRAEPATISTLRQEIAAATVQAPPAEEVSVEEVETVSDEVEAEAEVAAAPGPAHGSGLGGFVSELETSLGDGFMPQAPAAKPASKPAPAPEPEPEPAVAHASEAAVAHAPSVLGDFVADLESSLPDTFLPEAPMAPPAPPPPAAPAMRAQPVATPSGAAAGAKPAKSAPIAPPAVAPAAAAGASPFTYQPTPIRPLAPPPAAATQTFDPAAGVDLADMFGELKHELEEDTSAAEQDPETHYNLGVAFREMGLLDEAIGELQKVCQAVEHGHKFPSIMQTYTWLAQCFLDKGVPEAAIRWYENALNLPNLDGDTRTALHYELASSYETAKNKPKALEHFMQVYGSNIDYRDVAERIKALKS